MKWSNFSRPQKIVFVTVVVILWFMALTMVSLFFQLYM